ncbi:MAG: phage minor capsid protein [Clostridiales bacterium]|nr:phage minor capsid protein [Clostridiales bacterium]
MIRVLPPEYLSDAADDIVWLYSGLDEEIIKAIVKALLKNGRITDTAAWQIARAQDAGMLYDEIVKQAVKYSNKADSEVRAAFEEAGAMAVSYDGKIYAAAGLNIAMSPSAQALLNAGLIKTNGYLRNLTLTTASSAQTAYIEAASIAELQVSSGAFDYITSVRSAIQKISDNASWITYPTGHHDRIDVAVRRSVLTGVNQTCAQVSVGLADDMGCDLVETTAHIGARPEHAVWQGKVFSRSGNNRKYPDFVTNTRYGYGDGLCGWNCRHSFMPFFEGLSESAYPKQNLDEYKNKTVNYRGEKMSYYDATQRQRAMERCIRDTKRHAAAYDTAAVSAKDEAAQKAFKSDFTNESVKLKQQESKLKDLIYQTGLQKDSSRVQMQGFGHSQASKAVHSAKSHYSEWICDIGAKDSAPKVLANYYQEKYNNSPAYQLFMGYNKAIQKDDISPLVGLKQYTQTAHDIEANILGVTTATGVKIESYATHFIDRIIGQTSTPHPGMRTGVSIEDATDALLNPEKLGSIRNMSDGDIRQTFYGKKATVAISIRDKRLIQTNPR